ncbi:MAG: hypothetical protein J3K34DRAFT_415829 [Monoraphidium minutum]|nr:MAG: hypothetical protein J3K34DRAFT_415829 [Monoraphidium minutum]
MLMRFGEACDKAGMRSSQCKAYLGAAVAWLYAQNAREAWQVFQDAMHVDAFASSDEAFAADALFSAYAAGDAGTVRTLVQSKPAFRQLDASVGRLAVKLPVGDLAPQAAQISDLMGGGGGGGEEGEGSDDELM